MRRRTLLGAGAALLASGGASARAAPGRAAVVVASKLDTEGVLLGGMMLSALAACGIPVSDRLGLGPTALVRRALLAGEIDLYPEYTGNGALFFGLGADTAFRSAIGGWRLDRRLDAPNGITWLPAAPADNGWAVAVATPFGRRHGIGSLADLGPYLATGGPFRLAGSAEFVESPVALPALEHAYGFALRGRRLLVLSGGSTVGTEKAAARGISGVTASMAYNTDGALARLPLTVLADPRQVVPVYAPAPTIRTTVLSARPRIAGILAPVFASLDTATLRRLNARVVADGADPRRVARAHLRAIGIAA